RDDAHRPGRGPRRHPAVRRRRAGRAAPRPGELSLRRVGGRRAGTRGGRIVLGRMAAGGARTGRAAGPRGRAARVAGVARALVAVRARHRRVLRGMGVAPPPGPALTPRGAMTLERTTSVKYLKGVGPKRAEALARLGIRTVGDLLYHAPHRYLDATTVTPLARASLGSEATCVGRVVTTGVLPTRGLLHQHLDVLLPLAADPHPDALRARVGLAPLRDALAAVHRPATLEDAERGRRRLAFDEFFDQQLVQARARFLAKRARAGIRFALKRELTTRLKETLPFELTGDQKRAVREITDDMTAPERMHRLLMGDVGTGKTVVALFEI